MVCLLQSNLFHHRGGEVEKGNTQVLRYALLHQDRMQEVHDVSG